MYIYSICRWIFTYKDTDSVSFLGIFMSFKLVQLPSIYEYFIIIIIIVILFPFKFLKKVHRFSSIFLVQGRWSAGLSKHYILSKLYLYIQDTGKQLTWNRCLFKAACFLKYNMQTPRKTMVLTFLDLYCKSYIISDIICC